MPLRTHVPGCSATVADTLVANSVTSYDITITPSVSSGLASYPSGGWTKYEITPELNFIGQGISNCP